MKRTNDVTDKQLYLYAESRLGRADALSIQEREAIEELMQCDTKLREEAQQIEDHLGFLREIHHPAPAANLAALCLSRAQNRQTSSFRGFWLPVYATAVLVLVFMGGMWLGGALPRSTPMDPFQALMARQAQLVHEIGSLLEERSYASGSLWAAQLSTISNTADAIERQFETHRGDPLVEQRLRAVIYNNVLLLESLHRDLERGDSWVEKQMLQVKPNASRAI